MANAAPNLTRFEHLLVEADNSTDVAISLLLVWLAVCDGTVDFIEEALLLDLPQFDAQNVDALLAIAESSDYAAIQLACEMVQRGLEPSQWSLFIQLAIGMTVIDGRLTPAEGHALMFLADAFHVEEASFRELFESSTGTTWFAPGDPGQASYWQASEYSEFKNRGQTHGDMSVVNARRLLGVGPDATPQQVRESYRRLAQTHHPDRFECLGGQAKHAATETFKTIEQAYRVLKQHA